MITEQFESEVRQLLDNIGLEMRLLASGIGMIPMVMRQRFANEYFKALMALAKQQRISKHKIVASIKLRRLGDEPMLIVLQNRIGELLELQREQLTGILISLRKVNTELNNSKEFNC